MTDVKSQEIAVPQKKNGPIAIPQDWGIPTQSGGFITSIDDSTPEGKMQIFQILTVPGEKIDGYINKEVKLVGFLLTPAHFTDEESAEEVATIVTRLLLDDDTYIETHSVGVLKTLSMICQFFGQPPWKTPVTVMPMQQKLRGNKSWIVLKVVNAPKLPGQRERAKPDAK